MDHIFISELRTPARLGVYEWELAAPQTIQLDIEFAMPGAKAFSSDKIRDTVDYSVVVSRICEAVLANHFNLIETLAEAVAKLLLDEFKAPRVKVRVAKLAVIKGVKQVGVEIERTAVK
ncbi:MAG: dihydroneopterin aldolase [Burkholderiales bacterium]